MLWRLYLLTPDVKCERKHEQTTANLFIVGCNCHPATRQFIKQRREAAVNDASPVRSMSVEVKTKREFPAPIAVRVSEDCGGKMKYEAGSIR